MSKFSRENQLRLLRVCQDNYPSLANLMQVHTHRPVEPDIADLHYLAGHGLIELIDEPFGGQPHGKVGAKITSRGIDFLAEDGGLSAILGVVTVKVHQDTLRELLISRIEQAPADDDGIKARVIDQLKSLPAEGVRQIASKALEAGIKNLPNALQWVQAALA